MLTELPIWQQLQLHADSFSEFSLAAQFKMDPTRAQRMSAYAGPLLIDFSKNLLNDDTLTLLTQLGQQCKLSEQIKNLFSGKIVNLSEQQPALHTALRDPKNLPDSALQENIQNTLRSMEAVSEKIRQHQWLGYSGKPITDVINLGVGGSYLGPYMAAQALTKFNDTPVRLHFFANQHDSVLQRSLKQLNPATTLVLVSSKSFSTYETLHNFQLVCEWFKHGTSNAQVLQQHFIAITANPERARAYGIPQENIIPFWSWVGGRFSVWTAIGLPLCIAIGMKNFQEFLAGAAAVDQHFYATSLPQNIPALLALIDIWYIHFFSARSTAILPYHQDLYLLPRYLQQLSMESTGKSIAQDGSVIPYPTGKVLWGGVGSTGQHAYHQLLHQGTEFIPCDFVVTYEDSYLFAQCLAQTRALMTGQIADQPAQRCQGNRPSTTIVLSELSPYYLGALLALYEHKIYTQAVIWNINPFDQWGVEQSKRLGQELEDIVKNHKLPADYDNSTLNLLQEYYHWRNK